METRELAETEQALRKKTESQMPGVGVPAANDLQTTLADSVPGGR